MQNNYYFLKLLSRALSEKLIEDAEKPFYLAECFSQHKDEIILTFRRKNEVFFIKVLLTPDVVCFSFPDEHRRARTNNVDLFLPLLNLPLLAVHQFENERCFSFGFGEQKTLLFKIFGHHANLVLFEENEEKKAVVTDMFHKRMAKDADLDLDSLDRNIDQTETYFLENGLKNTFPTFDKNIIKYLQSPDWQTITKLLAYLEKPTFYILQDGEKVRLSLFEAQADKILFTSTDILEAANQFYYAFSKVFYFEREKNKALKQLEQNREKLGNYLIQNTEKLFAIEHENRYEEWANILMANMHQIDDKATEATLFDFYRSKDLTIKLKQDLSAQKNAEIYYRKGKNQKKEIEILQQNTLNKQTEKQAVEREIAQIEQTKNLKELRKKLPQESNAKHKNEVQLSFRRFEIEGYEVLVGKNAKNNDLLTRYAYKEDLWLHARDVSGSHVVVKYKAGKPFPASVIEKAAQLAAWHSKRRNESLCPVIYTPRKYVRKTKDLADGAVIVEREQVLMVVPHLLV